MLATSTRATPPNPSVPTSFSDRLLPTRSGNKAVQEDPSTQPESPTASVRRTPRLQPVQNRVEVLLVHIPKLSIRGQARLAAEVGVSRSTISRLVNGRINPSYRLARGVTTALERLLGYPLDMRDVFSTDGTYLTPSGCALCRCGGCLPDRAYDPEGNMRPEWRDQSPGDWSMTRSSGVNLLAGTDPVLAYANKSDAIVPSNAAIPNAQEVL